MTLFMQAVDMWTKSLRDALPGFVLGLAMVLTPGFSESGVAQEKPTVPAEDYGRFENLGAPRLSPDGAWTVFRVTTVAGDAELRIGSLSDDFTQVVADGNRPLFAASSDWLAWSVEPSADERERLEAADEPVRNAAGVMNLATRELIEFESVASFSFDAEGRFLALHGYAPEEPAGRGADLRVVHLEMGTTTTFGNVGELAWSTTGSVLALAVATGEDSGGNGVQVWDGDSGRMRTLASSTSRYRQLSWRDQAADLSVLRSSGPASEDGVAYDVVAWTDVLDNRTEAIVLASGDEALGADVEISRHARPQWSADGSMISIGLRPTESDEDGEAEESGAETEQPAEPGTGPGEQEPETSESGGPEEPGADEPELPGVQIWHAGDVRVYPQQVASRAADERRTLLSVWHLGDGRVVRVGTDLLGSSRILEGWEHALEDLAEPYGWGEMFGRPYHDVWVVDLDTGDRDLLIERVRWEWPSSGGGYVVSFDGAHYASIDVESRERVLLTEGAATVFADTAYDTPTDMLPPYGFQPAWLEADGGVLLHDATDVWLAELDGSRIRRLTEGAESGVTHRVASLPDDGTPGLDPADPIYLTLYDQWTEERGYARTNTDGGAERLVYADANVFGLTRADSADVFAHRRMAFDDSPDVFVSGPDLGDARQVSELNPFMDEYAWGRSELIDYVSESGRPLQAVLYLPAHYVEGEPVPTIVYTYEMRSPSIHTFSAPNERNYYNFTAWTQHGYAVLQPDIVYQAREPGMSALASVRAAVQAAVDRGVTDPEAVGLIGHSWGGYQATFLPTRTDIFAASVAGAPLTDFVSFMGQLHWNQGVPELSHWETGQGRMEVPFWEDPEAHRRNSPIHKVHEMETPLLMAFGDDDGVVDWDQGTEFYNFARRAGKQMVLLVYEGENHGFTREPNQVDYHRRILEWFGHYLKGEPAARWITDGVSLEDHEREKRRVAGGSGGT